MVMRVITISNIVFGVVNCIGAFYSDNVLAGCANISVICGWSVVLLQDLKDDQKDKL